MRAKEPSVEFDYEQVDRALGWKEPGEIDQGEGRAIETFKQVVEWCMRPGRGKAKATPALVYQRFCVVCWMIQPSRTAGTTLAKLAVELSVGVGALKDDAEHFRKTFRASRRRNYQQEACQPEGEPTKSEGNVNVKVGDIGQSISA